MKTLDDSTLATITGGASRADVSAKLAELSSSVKTLAQPPKTDTTMLLMMAMLARR